MYLRTLLRRNLRFHRRGNLAVLLGVAVGTAVLAGALLVGDSLRGSLRDRAESRLVGYDFALVVPRFVRTVIAPVGGDVESEFGITVRASVQAHQGDSPTIRRVPGVTVWATNNVLPGSTKNVTHQLNRWHPSWRVWEVVPAFRPGFKFVGVQRDPIQPGHACVSRALADALGVTGGEEIELQVARPSAVPRESLLGRRSADDATERLKVTVDATLADGTPAAELSLTPGVATPLNIFVSLPWLQERLGQPGRANVVLCQSDTRSVGELQQQLRRDLTLDDWSLVAHGPTERAARLFERLDTNKDGKLSATELRARIAEAVVQAMDADGDRALTRAEVEAYYAKRGVVDLESKQMLLEPAVERAAVATAKEMGLRFAPTLVYLANEIGDGTATVPYSVIAAIDESQAAPLGPFVPPVANAPGSPLADDEIVLADWPASPLKAAPGATVTLKFFEPEQEGRIKERTETFRLRGRIPLTGVAADPDLSPEFPGITDKLTLAEWDPPFPYDNQKVQKRDEEYWDRYRTTPKAYLSMAAGKKLFGSRFGEATSIRLAVPPGQNANLVAKEFGDKLLAKLDPATGGFVFEDVRAKALAASNGGQDFGMLFLGFSFFLIAAALVLVGLLTRLNLERRASEVGLLLASGFRVRTVRRLLLVEGLVLAALGGLLGLVGAVGYAALMLRLLAALWPDGTVGSFLSLHVTGQSLAIGYVAALVVSLIAIAWAVRGLGKVAPSALIAGVVSVESTAAAKPKRYGWRVVVAAALAVVLLVAGNFVHGAEERAGTFFGGGALALTAALMAVWAWLKRPQAKPITPGTSAAVARLGVRNAGRNPSRSLLTASLLASAAFLLVAVESFRRSPEADFLAKTGGSGGYSLVAESDLPLYQDPAGPEGRQDLLDALERAYQKQPGSTAAAVKAKLADASKVLDATTIVPIRVKAGDDASCLNLYQPGRPRIVGVPTAMMSNRFHVTSHANLVSESQVFIDRVARFFGRRPELSTSQLRSYHGTKDDPWSLLNEVLVDVPVFGEANTVQWMLKSGVQGVVPATDGTGNPVKLRIVGLLKDSVFQGELLMSDANFRKLYPREEGYSMFLIDGPPEVRGLLETAYAARGLSVTPAIDKLRGYLAVENTYLSTFQVLGGFGLLLGALGLAVVLLRGVWERRGELALMRALGYRRASLGGMVFAENAALLLLGLGAGVGAALLAVAPQLAAGAGAVPGPRLAGLLGLVVAAGLAAGWLAVRATLRAPLAPALRKE
ncbi:MAG: EF-hand domain-containing protein [Gemmataceae bacterium]